MTLRAFLRLIRIKQWSKNLLVFAAMLFTGGWTGSGLPRALMAFFAMCLVASATYIFNDLRDIERDRQHPTKKDRPLAAGQIPAGVAVALALVCALGGLALGAYLNKACLALLAGYLVLQFLYNLELKRVPIADVFVLALGFIIRATLGAAAVGVQISGWLLVCTAALSLMLGFGKRRHEYLLQQSSGTKSREVLEHYSQPVLDAAVIISAAGAAQSYATYSLLSKTAQAHPGLMFTSLFVIYGILRYVYLIFGKSEGGEPESILLNDKHILIAVAGFVLFSALAVKGALHFGMIEGMN